MSEMSEAKPISKAELDVLRASGKTYDVLFAFPAIAARLELAMEVLTLMRNCRDDCPACEYPFPQHSERCLFKQALEGWD